MATRHNPTPAIWYLLVETRSPISSPHTQVYLNDRPQYIKVIGPTGHVEHRPWASVYNRMRAGAGIEDPGYIIHESASWSDVHQKWFFLPRRASDKR